MQESYFGNGVNFKSNVLSFMMAKSLQYYEKKNESFFIQNNSPDDTGISKRFRTHTSRNETIKFRYE